MRDQCQRVGVVILTYNSSLDLPDCLQTLDSQEGVDARIIVVDNASQVSERKLMQSQFLAVFPAGRILGQSDAPGADFQACFVDAPQNAGYSAGNNIGIRRAIEMQCSSILIINPDVRLNGAGYLATLAALLIHNPDAAVACSSVVNLSGEAENPSRELTFLEELLLPLRALRRKRSSTREEDWRPRDEVRRIQRASGACLLIDVEFLKRIGLLDERVFLYCEESILRAQVERDHRTILMAPQLLATHAHRPSAKGAKLPRYRAWARSRSYYLREYSGYGPWRRWALSCSRSLLLLMILARGTAQRLLGHRISVEA